MVKCKMLWQMVPKKTKKKLLIGTLICILSLAFLCIICYWRGYSNGVNIAKVFYEEKMLNSCLCWG